MIVHGIRCQFSFDGIQALAWYKHKLKFVLRLSHGIQALAWYKHKLKFVLRLSQSYLQQEIFCTK
jgi:hypothetical protein